MKNPWLKFFVSDWLGHPGLRSCTPAARALAVDMLCLMHQGEPYGHLRIGTKDLDLSGLARNVGAPDAEVSGWLRELLEAGVFDRTAEGRIYSPRMVRDEEKRVVHKERGSKGGNPRLKQEGDPRDNPTTNPGDNHTHARARSEVRDQKSEPILAASKPRRAALEAASAHPEATRAWCEIFEKETGGPYHFNGSLDGKKIAALLKFPDFSLEELRRRAVLMLQDPFWAERGVDLKRFVSQWPALGNAGRRVDSASERTGQPSEDERAWARRALKDPDPINQEQARKRLQRWGMTEGDLLGESA